MNKNALIHRPPRWPVVATACVAALYAAYLALGNLLLNSSIGHGLANRKPEKFVGSWSTAWTLYPGHLHLNDVRIAGHSGRMIWSVQADSARGRIAMWPLLSKEVRVPRLIATGMSGGASLVDVRRIPPAPRPGGWTLNFARIDAENVRHAYFNDFVLVGHGKARAAFVKVLRGGPMEVLPSHAEFSEGTVWRRGQRLAWDSRLGADLAIARHRRAEAPGIRKLEQTDLRIGLDARTAGLMLKARAGQKPRLEWHQGPGSVAADLHWQRGALAPGGYLRALIPVLDDIDGKVESTAATVNLVVQDDGIELLGGLKPLQDDSLSIDVDLRVRGNEVPAANIASLAQRTSGRVVSQWHFESLAWLAGFLPPSIPLSFDGAGSARAQFQFHDGKLDPGSLIEIPQVAASAVAIGNRFDGDARATIVFEAAGEGQLQPHLRAVMQKFQVAPAETPDRPYVYGTDLRIDALTRGTRTELDDRVRGSLSFSDARVPDLRVYNRYLPGHGLRFVGGSGTVSGDMQFDREGQVGKGEFKVAGREVHLALGDVSLHGDIEIDTKLRRADLGAHSFTIDGSHVSLKRIHAENGSESLGTDWWGDVHLEKARLHMGKSVDLDSSLQVRMKDVGVLLALYSQRKELPGWIGKLIDAGEVNAQGRVKWRGGTLVLQPFAATNDRFDVAARLRMHEKQPTGDLYAAWGAVGVGVELAGGRRDLHLVGARKWFDARPPLASP